MVKCIGTAFTLQAKSAGRTATVEKGRDEGENNINSMDT